MLEILIIVVAFSWLVSLMDLPDGIRTFFRRRHIERLIALAPEENRLALVRKYLDEEVEDQSTATHSEPTT